MLWGAAVDAAQPVQTQEVGWSCLGNVGAAAGMFLVPKPGRPVLDLQEDEVNCECFQGFWFS